MKHSIYKIFILTLLGFIHCSHGKNAQEIQIKDEEFCLSLRYKNPNVTDKPDILIVKAILRPKIDQYPPFPAIGVCRLKNGDSDNRAKLIERLDFESSKEFEYDSRTGNIYQGTYDYKLQAVKNGKRQDVYKYDDDIFVSSNEGDVVSYALDWVTKNLFVARWDNVQIYNLNDNSKSPITVIKHLRPNGNYPPMIKVFPNEGYLIAKTDLQIIRYNQNGTNSLVLYEDSDDYTICKMALDYYEQKIYWFESHRWSRESRIRYINLNGESGTVTLESHQLHNSTCNQEIFQVDEKYVYFTKGKTREPRIVRVRKVDGKLDDDFEIFENFEPNSGISGRFYNALVLNGNPQVVLKDHPCQRDNGGCKGFCVAVPDEKNKLTKQCIDTYVQKVSSWKKFWKKIIGIFD